MNSLLLVMAILIAGGGWYWTSSFRCSVSDPDLDIEGSCTSFVDEVATLLGTSPSELCDSNICYYSISSVNINCPWIPPLTYLGYVTMGLWTVLLFAQCTLTKFQLKLKDQMQLACGAFSIFVTIYGSAILGSHACTNHIVGSPGFVAGTVVVTGLTAIGMLADGADDIKQSKLDKEKQKREHNLSIPNVTSVMIQNPYLLQPNSNQQPLLSTPQAYPSVQYPNMNVVAYAQQPNSNVDSSGQAGL